MKREAMCADWLRVCVCWVGCLLPRAHVAVLMSLSWWLVPCAFCLGCARLRKNNRGNFLSILLPKSFDFCLELCYDICVKRKEMSLVWIDGWGFHARENRRKSTIQQNGWDTASHLDASWEGRTNGKNEWVSVLSSWLSSLLFACSCEWEIIIVAPRGWCLYLSLLSFFELLGVRWEERRRMRNVKPPCHLIINGFVRRPIIHKNFMWYTYRILGRAHLAFSS